jgi:hypothetical protein
MSNLSKAALRVTKVENHSLSQSREILANKVQACEEEKDSAGGREGSMLMAFNIGGLAVC